jgi:3-phosphoshikimate 1-carboxyvinyltransferase
MKPLGVNTTQESGSLILTKSSSNSQPLSFDCYNNPDLFPTMAATCAGLRREAHFRGIANLHFKESDRVEAMKVELAKIGADLVKINDNELFLKPARNLPFFEASNPLLFASHDDHRIVMALAPLSLKLGSITFDHPEVVAKSYPGFLEKMGKILPILRM